uniref:Uncharacterized protein n=1 Tax=viral metagenome TaxID=1070528 RepID=A0A6C0I1D9_9ZZZZ
MEIIDIGLSDLEPISLDSINLDSNGSGNVFSAPGSSGGGLEFLMNTNKSVPTESMNIDLGELDKLEKELNNLSSSSSTSTNKTVGLGGTLNNFANFFGLGGNDAEAKTVKIDTGNTGTDSKLGEATVDSMGNTKTWDGFSKMAADIPSTNIPKVSERERRRKKNAMLKKLDEWYEKGQLKTGSNVTADSSYEDIEDEYEAVMEDKRKKDSVKLQQWWFMTFVNSLEYANSAFNPFDINLDGWGEQVSEDIDSYDEIFSELHDKYKGGKLAPELSLLLRLGFSAAMVNFTNKALSSATPAFNDVIKQSPELMRAFTNATANSMSQSSPGFAMANQFFNNSQSQQQSSQAYPQSSNLQGPARNMGPPPPPLETKNMPPPPRPGSGMQFTDPVGRPDVSMARGAMFREKGADISSQYENPNAPSQAFNMQPPQRQEMRGPQNADLDNILSGLKPKTRTVEMRPSEPINTTRSSYGGEDDSIISITSLKDMQDANGPKRTNRRKRNGSEKNINTISLDLNLTESTL